MKTALPILPRIQELKELLSYCPDTGELRWKINRSSQKTAGQIAGYQNRHGYRAIKWSDTTYGEHRLAWVLFYNEEAPATIDHRNGNPSDNRIVNLRAATKSQNRMNSRLGKSSSSGIKGVSWNTRDRVWRAKIRAQGKTVHLGSFDDKALAAAAYMAAAKSLHGEFARV